MKKLLILVSLFFFLKEASSQDFYYHEGRRINLEQRTDKVAIVLNSNSFTKEYLLSSLSGVTGSSKELKEVSQNFYLVNFKEKTTEAEINNYINSLGSRNNLIKFATPVYYGQSKSVTQIPGDEFIVRLRNVNDKNKLDLFNMQNNIQIVGNVGDDRGFLLKSNNNVRKNALELSDIYYRAGIFEYAQPNFYYPEGCLLNSTPNDPNYGQQWALNNTGQLVPTGGDVSAGDLVNVNGIPNADMNVNLAWDFTTGTSTLEVGVVDSGIDSTHPDFSSAGHLLAGYDAFFNKNGVPRDSGNHGTATAGLIGAVMNNALGVAGIAPSCKLMSIRIFDKFGTTNDIAIGRGFDTARVRGIDVLSNSWGGGTPNATTTNAINSASTSGRGGLGCVILFSSGNDGQNPPSYPSYLPNVICVGASTTHDQKKSPGTGNQFYWGGNYGSDINGDIDITAPTICYTTDVQGIGGYNTSAGTAGNYYSTFNGTSCSCPNAAGIAALVLSVNTSQTRLQVTDKLLRGADKIDNVPYSTTKTYGKWSTYFGYGRVNALNSVRLAAGVDVTPPSINHLNVSNITSTYPVVVTAEVVDQDGGSIDFMPKLFFRKNKNNAGYSAFDSVTAALVSGDTFTFYIPSSGYETQVQYYIKASDNIGNATTFPRGAPNTFWLCYFAVGTFNTVTNVIPGFVAPDAGAGYSPSAAFGSFTIVNSKVRIYLRHTYVSDEIIQLVSPIADPNNNRKALFSRNGGDLDNITGTTVADSASLFWNAGTPPYLNGLFKPDYVLNGYNGTNANGSWRFLNIDAVGGDVPNFDSVRITFTKTTGTTSPSVRLNSQSDSVVSYGTVNYPDSVTKNYYMKNVGTANLTVSGATFSGIYASQCVLVSALPGPIAPNDSGLFAIRIKTMALDGFNENAVLSIANNDPNKPILKVSLQSDNLLPVAGPCEDFSTAVFPPPALTEEFSGTNYWTRQAVSAFGIGSGSAKFDFFNASAGTTQSLVSNNFANTVANTYLTFDEAYSGYGPSFPGPDSLIIEASTNYGSSYSVITVLQGKADGTGELNSAPATTSPFVPANSQWRSKIYSLPVNVNKVRLKAKSGFGNNLYVDNLCVKTLLAPVNFNVGCTPQGFYRGTPTIYSGIPDTIKAYLYRTDFPNVAVDSGTQILNAFTNTNFIFQKALSGTYYIKVKHRNSIETWSKAGGQPYTRGVGLIFDFLNINSAFNNNEFQVSVPNNLWGMFGGDVDQNGFVNLSDITLVANDASLFTTGYKKTDVTGNNVTDLNDVILTFNNSNGFVSIQKPAGAEPEPAPSVQPDGKRASFENEAQREKYESGLLELSKTPKNEVKEYQPWNPMPSKEYLEKLIEARKEAGRKGKVNKPRF